jgi:hypothetical protein
MGGCDADQGFPVNPPGGGLQPTAGVATGGGHGTVGASVQGRVCMITTDPRALGDCAVTGAAGLIVSLGGATTTTTANGSFVLATPAATNGLVFNVTGANVVPSTQAFSAVNTIPVFTTALFDQVLAANGVQLPGGSGSIFASVLDSSGNPIANVTASAVPASAFPPLFDGSTPTTFGQSQTGQLGIVFFPGLTTNSPTTLTFSDLTSGQESTVGGVQVFDGGITFVEQPIL